MVKSERKQKNPEHYTERLKRLVKRNGEKEISKQNKNRIEKMKDSLQNLEGKWAYCNANKKKTKTADICICTCICLLLGLG